MRPQSLLRNRIFGLNSLGFLATFLILTTLFLLSVTSLAAQAPASPPNSLSLANASTSVLAPTANISQPEKPKAGLSSLPAEAQAPISAALGKDEPSYWVHSKSGGDFHAENRQQRLAMDFTKAGAQVRSHDAGWALETLAYGYGGALHAVSAAAPHVSANRVEYRRGNMTEWYANGPVGLEQGFTFAEPPGKTNGQPLTVELAFTGDLVAALQPDRTTLTLTRKDGQAVLHYTGLTARDAAGKQLQSWLELKDGRLLLRVNENGARYPLVIDPWIQQAELIASDGAANDNFGYSVSVSGSTALIGAPNHTVNGHADQGAAYVFVQNGSTWSQQQELTASGGGLDNAFGTSVALNGSTAVIGAAFRFSQAGAAYVFVQSGSTWSEQAKLTPSDGVLGDFFGFSVAMSSGTVVVGSPFHTVGSNQQQGAAYVYTQSGSTWSQQAELTSSDGAPDDFFGWSVAVSGSTAMVGALYHNSNQGAVYVFVQSGSTWSQQQELTCSDPTGGDTFGVSVAMNSSTALIGAQGHMVGSNQGQGAAYVFAQSGNSWSQQAELTSSDGEAGDDFGSSVALSGTTAVVGAFLHPVGSNQDQGAAYVFVENGNTWSQQAELTSSDGAPNDYFGWSVAVSGSTAVVGAYQHIVGSNSQQGAAYVYVQPPPGIYAPASGSTLTSSSVIFQWAGYPGATAYWLDVGSTQYGNNYEQTGSLSSSTLSYTVNGLPTDGSTVYATWWYDVGGQWQYVEYSYTAFGSAAQKGTMTSPAPGSTLSSSNVTFTWTAGSGDSAYWLDVGSTLGGNNYYQSGNLGNVLTTTANGLPINGSTVYVTLWSLVDGQWLNNEYTYTAFNESAALGVMQTPTPGSTLYGNPQTFTWSAGSGATAYELDIGSAFGGNNYYQSGNLGNVLTTTVYSLPVNGSQIYVTLWSYVGGQWYYNEYTYTSSP